MISIIIGFVLVFFTVFACLPSGAFGLGWGSDIVLFLKGASPVFSAGVGIVSLMVGFADVRDKREAKREEAESEAVSAAPSKERGEGRPL